MKNIINQIINATAKNGNNKVAMDQKVLYKERGYLGCIEGTVKDYWSSKIQCPTHQLLDMTYETEELIKSYMEYKGIDIWYPEFENDSPSYSDYALSLKTQVILEFIITEDEELYDEMEELVAEFAGDYVESLIQSVWKRAKETKSFSYAYREIEPYMHVFYLTGTGHMVTKNTLAPYYLYKIYGLMGNLTPAEVEENNYNVDNVGIVASIIPENQWCMLLENSWALSIGARYEYIFHSRPFKSYYGFIKAKEAIIRGKDTEQSYQEIVDTIDSCTVIEDKYIDRRIKKLKDLFSKKGGRTPKCLDTLAVFKNIPLKFMVNRFNYKIINALKEQGYSMYTAIKCMYYLGSNAIGLPENVAMALCNRDLSIREWVYNHRKTDPYILFIIANDKRNRIDINAPIADIKRKVKILRCPAEEDLEEILDKGYSINNSIENIKVEDDGFTAEIINLDTYDGKLEAVSLGYLTHCCQHLDGAGESAMLFSLANGGFWKVVNPAGKLIAQAACWTYEGKFVFDNIEFANNRKADSIIPILRKWVEACPYKDVYMGIGYNKLTVGGIRMTARDADLLLPSERVNLNVYTDASSVEMLKGEGIVLF